MNAHFRRWLLFCAILCGLANRNDAAVVVLNAFDDGAGTDQPKNGVFDHFFPSNSVYLVGGQPDAEYRSVVDFSLSSIPKGATISSATLHLTTVAAAGSGGTVGVIALLHAGNGVAEISDLTLGGTAVGPANVSFLSFPTIDFTYTTAFQTLITSGVQFAEFTLQSNPSSYVLEFGSRNYSNVDARPTRLCLTKASCPTGQRSA
jgi:hypothetical protein